MGKTLSRNPCPECGSNDNLITYLTESGYERSKCKTPGCNYTMSTENTSVVTKQQITPGAEPEVQLMLGEIQALEDRGISLETCQDYDYRVQGEYQIMNYPDGDQKIRLGHGKEKKIFWTKNRAKSNFFGQNRDHNTKYPLVIAEGEIDAMSIYQAGVGNVISVRDGAGSLVNQLHDNLAYLLTFTEVIVVMDNDKAGNEALRLALEQNDLKFKIAKMPEGQDPNDFIKSGQVEELLNIIESADYPRPTGLVTGAELDFATLLKPESKGLQTPFPLFNTITGGIKKGRLYVVGGGTGTGKSTYLRELAYHMIEKQPGIKIANLFLEEQQKTTLKAYFALDNNIPYHIFAENPNMITPAEFEYSRKKFSSDNLMFTSASFELNSQRLFQILEYLAFSKKYDIIILDHISMVAGTSNVSRNGERRDIDDLMYKIVSIINKCDTTILAAVHLTDPSQGKDYEEGRVVKMSDFRGSGAIKQTADVCIGLERNMMHENQQTKLQTRILKNRISAKLGPADLLYYMESTGRYTSDPMR